MQKMRLRKMASTLLVFLIWSLEVLMASSHLHSRFNGKVFGRVFGSRQPLPLPLPIALSTRIAHSKSGEDPNPPQSSEMKYMGLGPQPSEDRYYLLDSSMLELGVHEASPLRHMLRGVHEASPLRHMLRGAEPEDISCSDVIPNLPKDTERITTRICNSGA